MWEGLASFFLTPRGIEAGEAKQATVWGPRAGRGAQRRELVHSNDNSVRTPSKSMILCRSGDYNNMLRNGLTMPLAC